MNKEQYIDWWKNEALKNWETAMYLMKGKQNVFALFTLHLTIEKLLKAHWIKDNIDNSPPRTHDLLLLYNQTELELKNGFTDHLSIINEWNIESRYPDYKLKIYKRATDDYTKEHSEKISKLKKCLLQEL